MAFHVYILHSKRLDLFYIGVSENPETRLRKHLSSHRGFTSRTKDWIICYKEDFEEKINALKREKQLKSWKNKERIQQLVRASKGLEHPDL